jgi:hypothetical protein
VDTHDKFIEIRQAKLLAIGTPADSIIFTADTVVPVSKYWDKIFLNGGSMQSQFNYCSFSGAFEAIN